MDERIRINQEEHKSLEAPKTPERLPDAEHAEPLRKGEKDPTKEIREEEARETIEEINEEDKSISPLEKLDQEVEKAKPLPHKEINEQLQKITLHRELNNIRKKLSTSDKTLSKVVHAPVIRTFSEAGAKTIARPSGIIGGSITAFVGTTAYLLLAKWVGFSYNYFVFIALFILGFGLGLTIEVVSSALVRKKN